MATNNTIKLADTLISYIKTQLCGELTADNCRLVVGKSYPTYEAAAVPYEALRNRLTAALELGRWPEQ